MKPTVPQVMPLVRAIYRRNFVGCCLHIVLDDGNTKDSHVQFCLEQAREEGHADCLELAEKIALMSRAQRRKLWHDDTKYR